VLACTAAFAVAAQRRRGGRRGRGEEAVHPAVAPLGGAADAAGPSEGPAGVDVRQVEADAAAWVAGDGEERQREQQAEEEPSLGGH